MEPIIREIPAGAEVNIAREGDFIFVIDCGHDMDVLLGNQGRALAVPGAMIRPPARFPKFAIRNPDPERPAFIRMIVGEGSYTSQIIQGEVTVNPGIRGQNGQFVDDTRSTIRLRAAFGRLEQLNVGAGDQIREVTGDVGAYPTNARAIPLGRDRILVSHTSQPWRLYENGSYTAAPTMNDGNGDAVGALVGNEIWVIHRETAGVDHLAVRAYDAATLHYRRQFATGITSGYQYARAMTVAGDRMYIKTDDNAGPDRVFMTDLSGRLLASAEVSITAHSVVVADGKVHLVPITGFDASVVVLDATTLAPLPASESVFPDLNLESGDLGTLYSAAVNGDGDLVVITRGERLAIYSPDGVTISATGSVTACAGAGRFKSSQVETIAELYTQRLDNGRVLASGELLRALLELYTGRYMPADYLDYVYAVRADNLNGISPRIIESGGQSFAAAGIEDDAAGTFPQTIEITLREGLL